MSSPGTPTSDWSHATAQGASSLTAPGTGALNGVEVMKLPLAPHVLLMQVDKQGRKDLKKICVHYANLSRYWVSMARMAGGLQEDFGEEGLDSPTITGLREAQAILDDLQAQQQASALEPGSDDGDDGDGRHVAPDHGADGVEQDDGDGQQHLARDDAHGGEWETSREAVGPQPLPQTIHPAHRHQANDPEPTTASGTNVRR
ncbi:unnamed protein product [Parajaminaea phylloscopi]